MTWSWALVIVGVSAVVGACLMWRWAVLHVTKEVGKTLKDIDMERRQLGLGGRG